MSIEDIIKSVLQPRRCVQFVYLFGSIAKGSKHPLSDYDIAVYIDDKKKPRCSYGVESYLSALFAGKISSDRVQITLLNNAPPLVAYEAVNSGILIFKKNELLHHNFVFRTYQRYIDLKRLYERQNKALLNRIKDGTYGG